MQINVLLVEPGKPPCPAVIENTVGAFSEVVGGPVVGLGSYLPERVILYCHENSEKLPHNRFIPGDKEPIRGTFLLCSFDGPNLISLDSAQQEKFIKYFSLEME